MVETSAARLRVMNLGRAPYRPVHALQERLAARRKAGEIDDTLVLVEHEPVYTLGRSAKEENILLERATLAARGIEVVETGRGGDVTYHGPGQLVAYPIIDLREKDLGAVSYVSGLEEVLIRVLAGFGITAGTDEINRGVWVGSNKVAAIGVRISRGITMHGFALNVATDMGHYAAIVPCGIRSRGVTSLALLGVETTLEIVAQRVCSVVAEIFDYSDIIHDSAAVGECGGEHGNAQD